MPSPDRSRWPSRPSPRSRAPLPPLVPDIEVLLESIRLAPRPIVLIDGRSGSGKSTLAARLAPLLDAELVRLDDIYPGWDGLRAGSNHVETCVLSPHPRWRAWDWDAARPGQWHEIDASRAIVVEGSGALSRANRARATYGIWVELAASLRKQRALARDGDSYAPYWDRWARQEEEFAAAEHPLTLADITLVG